MKSEAEISAAARPGRAFSNGTEFEIWASEYCYECIHDDPDTETYCPILGVAISSGTTPAEWTKHTVESKYGAYEAIDTCTEFEERPGGPDDGESPEPDPVPPFDPEMPGQVDIFEVFVDQGLAELADQREAVRS